jgi:hypothetical protein
MLSATEHAYRTMLVYNQYTDREREDISEEGLTRLIADLRLLADEYAIDFDECVSATEPEVLTGPAYIRHEPSIIRVLDLVDEDRMTYDEALDTVSADPDTPSRDRLHSLVKLWCGIAGIPHPTDRTERHLPEGWEDDDGCPNDDDLTDDTVRSGEQS